MMQDKWNPKKKRTIVAVDCMQAKASITATPWVAVVMALSDARHLLTEPLRFANDVKRWTSFLRRVYAVCKRENVVSLY